MTKPETGIWIYAQDGTHQPIKVLCPMFSEWLRVHDRYSGAGKITPKQPSR